MKLYTVQPQIVIDELNKSGIVYPISVHDTEEYDEFKKAYAWLYEQMRIMGKDMGINNGGMFWAHNRKSDTRYYKGKGLLLELDKPIEQIIVSDYNMWHCPLNSSPVVTDEADYDYWFALKNNKELSDNYLYESWKKILDIKISKKHRIQPGKEVTAWYDKGEQKVYQTCFTYIKVEDVKNITLL